MAATMTEIRSGLAARLETISDLNQTSAYMIDAPMPPMMQVMGPDEVEFDLAMQRGLDRMVLVVQAFAGTPDSQSSQELVDGWLAPSGSTSVKAAVEGDVTLGGLTVKVRVTRASGYRIYDLRDGRTLGCEFFVEVFNQK